MTVWYFLLVILGPVHHAQEVGPFNNQHACETDRLVLAGYLDAAGAKMVRVDPYCTPR